VVGHDEVGRGNDGQGEAMKLDVQVLARLGCMRVAVEGLVLFKQVVARNAGLLVGSNKRAIANTVCITTSVR
jgi:hypothetical protein